MESLSDSDPDFWEQGVEEKAVPHQGKRPHHKKSKGFAVFPLNEPEPNESTENQHAKDHSLRYKKLKIKDYNNKEDDGSEENNLSEDSDVNINDTTDDYIDAFTNRAVGENEREVFTDDENCDHNGEREEGSGNSNSSKSKTSKRTSIVLSGSDLPQDSLKDDTFSKISSKSSKRSSIKPQWLVEQYLLTPQQKLKISLYNGRKLFAARECDGAVEEFVRARALARVVHGSQHWRYCRCKVFLAKTYLYLKGYIPQAETQAKEALEILQSHLSTHLAPAKKPQVHHTLLWGYLVCGEARTFMGQFNGAQESLAQALYHTRIYARMVMRWKKQLSPSLTIDLPMDLQVKVICAQATLYTKQKKITKAKEELQSSITLIEKKGSGPEDPCLVTPLQQLGKLMLDNPQTDEDSQTGLDHLARVVHITQVSNRPGSELECEARGLLLEHRLQLRCIESQEALRELHKLGLLFSRLHGEHSPRTTAIHNLTVQVLVQEENYPEAIKHLLSNLKHCREIYGDFTPQVCGLQRQLSKVHTLAGDFTRAAVVLDQCLQAEILLYGISSRRAQASRLRLQEIMQKLPSTLRKQIYRRHPDLQNKPRFHT